VRLKKKVHQKRMQDWIIALRYGELEQAKGSLHKKGAKGCQDSFCCLGVACEMALAKGFLKRRGLDGTFYEDKKGEGVAGALNFTMGNWIGMEDDRVVVTHKGKLKNVVELNDKLGLTFPEIADLLEEEYLCEPAE